MNWLFVLGLSLVAGCRSPAASNLELVRRSQPLLGTFVTISAYGADREHVQHSITEAFAEIRRIDTLMSLHRPDSELTRLNALASSRPILISPDLFRVIARAQQIAQQTDGSFDVTIKPLTDFWGFIWKEYQLPSSAQLRALLPRVNYRLIQLDTNKSTAKFLADGVSIDLGGIAKGYAVDCAIEKLQSLGVTNAMVKAGGDLRVIGAPAGSSHWEVQLEDPRKKQRRLKIPLRDAALSTSGNYENFFVVAGRRYSHILNPRDGRPVEGLAACTVIAPTCVESDAWATACFVFGVTNSLAKFGRRLAIHFTLMPRPDHHDWETRQSPLFPNVQVR